MAITTSMSKASNTIRARVSLCCFKVVPNSDSNDLIGVDTADGNAALELASDVWVLAVTFSCNRGGMTIFYTIVAWLHGGSWVRMVRGKVQCGHA